MRVQFHEITPDNWRKFRLEVNKEQERFVASYVAILARAYVYRHNCSSVLAVHCHDHPIGILMQRDLQDDEGRLVCILDQFFIDRDWQGRGYGKAAMQSWLTSVRRANRYAAIELCFIRGDVVAERLYTGLGFIRKPQADVGDELVMRYAL